MRPEKLLCFYKGILANNPVEPHPQICVEHADNGWIRIWASGVQEPMYIRPGCQATIYVDAPWSKGPCPLQFQFDLYMQAEHSK